MAGPASLGEFEGRWRVQREIEDRLGADARFEGVAEFVPDGVGLTYTETGQLTSGAQSFAASRRYLWRASSDGIDVFFEDARPFHQFAFEVQPSAGHFCAPDQYDVAYDFRDWPMWHATWEVRGPRKDYRMVTRYTRD